MATGQSQQPGIRSKGRDRARARSLARLLQLEHSSAESSLASEVRPRLLAAQLSQIQQWQGRLPPRLCRNRNHVTTKGVMLQIIGNSDDLVEGSR
jgi:hypothetical protein